MRSAGLKELLQRKTRLPASAIVGHALLSEDLGISGQRKIELIELLEEYFEMEIPAALHQVLIRVEDLDEYIQFEKSFSNHTNVF